MCYLRNYIYFKRVAECLKCTLSHRFRVIPGRVNLLLGLGDERPLGYARIGQHLSDGISLQERLNGKSSRIAKAVSPLEILERRISTAGIWRFTVEDSKTNQSSLFLCEGLDRASNEQGG